MRPSVHDRRRHILQIIQQHTDIKVAELASLAGVSAVTMRRDIEALAADGAVVRRHGRVQVSQKEPSPSWDTVGRGTIAVVCPAGNAYLSEITQGACQALERAGFRAILHVATAAADAERQIIQRLPDSEIDGVLFAPRWPTAEQAQEDYELLENLQLPTVLMERSLPQHSPSSLQLRHIDSVCSDHWHGAQLALDHLSRLGHRRILVATREDSPTARTLRMACDANAPLESLQVSSTDPDRLVELITTKGFTAGLVHNDEDALILTQRLAYAGVNVPDDFAVVAYDDTVAEIGAVPLTAVAPPKQEVGATAAEMVIHRVISLKASEKSAPRRIYLLPHLQARSST